MSKDTTKKAKQIAWAVGVPFAGFIVLNTLANRFQLVARFRNLVANGV